MDAYLRQHPDLCMAREKEVHFFDNDPHFSGSPNYDWYHKHFPECSNRQLAGESTPAYMFWLEAPIRIWQYNPNIKIIFLLRNPIERAYSHWNMQRTRGKDKRPFLQAINDEQDRCRQYLPKQCRQFSYIARGFYTEQIRRFQYLFPLQQLLFLESGEFRQSPHEILNKVWEFLDVPPVSIKPLPQKYRHSGTYDRAINNKEYSKLLFIYEYEIRQLERMLGWDCSAWLS